MLQEGREGGRLQIAASCYPGDDGGQSIYKQSLEEVWPLGSKQIIFQVGVDGWSTGGYRDGALLASYSVITRYAASCPIIWSPPAHYHPWTNIRMALQLINKHFEQTLSTRQWWHYKHLPTNDDIIAATASISLTNTQATRSLLLFNWGEHTQGNTKAHTQANTQAHTNTHRQTNTKTNTQAQTQAHKHIGNPLNCLRRTHNVESCQAIRTQRFKSIVP